MYDGLHGICHQFAPLAPPLILAACIPSSAIHQAPETSTLARVFTRISCHVIPIPVHPPQHVGLVVHHGVTSYGAYAAVDVQVVQYNI